MFLKPQHVHFVGIGGIGMSGIAEVLLSLGYQVSGSDLRASAITDRLQKLGARIDLGHEASHVAGAKAVVVTSAVDQNNPEIIEARRLQIPIIPRGEMLAELMRLKFGIAIAGSHGKTTTTSMVASILNAAGLDPTVVVGGRVAAMGGSNARIGKSQLLIVESDESDGSFLKLAPIIAVVTNIDREHLDHYAGIEDIRLAFTDFVNKVPFYGAAILCMEDVNIQKIFPEIRRRTITYGRTAQVDLEIGDVRLAANRSEFRVERNGSSLGQFQLNVPGIHNVLNATAALAVGLEMELKPEQIREGLAQFSGVDRRFTVRGVERGVTVVDDYGHHPTEIKATLAAARLSSFNKIRVQAFARRVRHRLSSGR
jgi:UDP-N-acetylmuramate--alanine ligase